MMQDTRNEKSRTLPKAGDLSLENFGAKVDTSVGRLIEKAWDEGGKEGTHMFVSADDKIKLPFLPNKSDRLQPRSKLARHLGRQGAVEAMSDDPDVHSVTWLADQPELGTSDGRERAIEMIRQVSEELEKRNKAKEATGSLSTAELERLLRERRKGY